ncbi:hypothetical protein BTJ39_06850 [Izhakiella australiensis]|uniref:CopG family transcriptional regulator n=1 Tax=Izhakiella australiensis TaxID=1926881 RepID=A0A1S8YNQ2_9GAMM|nr:hypothetical protein BTJ39_06850 [Izhakiella australiensis]
MTQLHHAQRSRTPRNAATGGTLPLRLTPEERATIEAMAEADCRSASNMVRIVFLRGLEAMQPNQ